MKHVLLTTALLFMSFSSYAQTTYEKTMSEKISKIELHNSIDQFTSLANDFDRIGNKESAQYLPYYYAAFSTIQKGRLMLRDNKLSELDAIAAEADKYIAKAEALSPDNSEIYILKKMTSSLKMMVDPMNRYMKDGQEAQKYLAKAKELDANNPRINLLLGEDTYFTPEQFGGSKTKGIELFKQSLDQFNNYKIKSSLDPNWGKSEAEYFISLAK